MRRERETQIQERTVARFDAVTPRWRPPRSPRSVPAFEIRHLALRVDYECRRLACSARGLQPTVLYEALYVPLRNALVGTEQSRGPIGNFDLSVMFEFLSVRRVIAAYVLRC